MAANETHAEVAVLPHATMAEPAAVPIAARQRAALRSALRSALFSSSSALAYADAGAAEALRAAGASSAWLAATSRVGLVGDVGRAEAGDATMAMRLLAGWDMKSEEEEEATPPSLVAKTPDRLLLLISSPDSLADASAALRTHSDWAIGRTTLLPTAAAAPSPTARRALAARLEADAGWPVESIDASRLAGAEWVPCGEAAFFVLPAATAWPLFPTAAADDDDTDAAAAAASLVGAALAAGAADAGLSLEPFALGPSPVAAAVAAAVAEAGGGGHKGDGVKTALIVVDARSVAASLAAPADHPVDRAVGLLPRLDNDVAVQFSASSLVTILHAAPDADGGAWLDALLARRGGDARLLLRKWLREAAREATGTAPARARAGAPSADELAALVGAVGESVSPAHVRACALGAAAAAAGRHPGAAAWDAAAAAAAALDVAAAEGGDAAGRDAVDAVARGAPLSLILAAYSHAVDAGAVLDPATDCLLSPETEAALSSAVGGAAAVLARLRAVACLRGRTLPPALRTSSRLSGDLAARLAARRPIPGATHVSTSLRALLAGAVGGLGRRAQTTPADCGAAIIFFVGGVAVADARAVLSAVADAGSALPVSIGGTCLLSPDQVMERVLEGCGEEEGGRDGGGDGGGDGDGDGDGDREGDGDALL